MSDLVPKKQRATRNFIVPWALFAGVVVSFVACCMAGRRTTMENQFASFTRFHQLLSPESQFYPTASQVHILAQKKTKREQINVIVGGSSILNGVRQLPDEVWTDKLAELLGPDYRVLNLGCRAGSGEVDILAAEALLKRRRLILLRDAAPIFRLNAPDGDRYRYIFWDAWYKGLVDRKLPRRNKWVRALTAERRHDAKFMELRTGARLDAAFYFNDLWTTLAYTTVGTVWNAVSRSDSFRPRRLLHDNETGPMPMALRLEAMDRHFPMEEFTKLCIEPKIRKTPNGQWEAEPDWLDSYRENLKDRYPNEALRQRTIALIQLSSPHGLNQMSAEEREQWRAQAAIVRRVLDEAQIHSVEIGEGFSAEDYADHFHLAGSGGEKMAVLVAPEIRKLAKSLGYEEAGEKK